MTHTLGDIVTAARDIWEEADECHPLHLLAAHGDQLEIRRVGDGDATWPYYVGHLHREADAMFGVQADEIRRL